MAKSDANTEIKNEALEEISELPGVGEKTAKKLFKANFGSLRAIASASKKELIEKAELGADGVMATKIIEAAKSKLRMGFMQLKDVKNEQSKIEYISTSSTALDGLLGGGVRTQTITEASGIGSGGKTQIGLQIAINCVKQTGKKVYIIDTESTISAARLIEIGAAAGLTEAQIEENILVARAYNSDMQIAFLEQIEEKLNAKEPIKLIIVDSLMSHFRSEFTGRGELAPRQQSVNQFLHRLQRLADVYNIAVYVTNQVSANPTEWGAGFLIPVGGNIVGHACNARLRLTKGKLGNRKATLIDSADLPEGEVEFCIKPEGIRDIDED